jgi:hypothetical protein
LDFLFTGKKHQEVYYFYKMKLTNRLSFILALLLICFSACQKPIVFVEGSGPGGGPKTNGSSMSAKVDGVLVECEFATSQSWIDNLGKKNIQLNGLKNPQGFIITWQDFKGVGNYDALDLVDYVAGITDPLTQAYFAESGTVKVTTYTNKVIIGTFEFIAINSNGQKKTITEGKFTINLQEPPAPIPPTGTEAISAKVDGTYTGFIATAGLVINPILGKTLSIGGSSGDKRIYIGIYDFKGNGTYNIDNIIAQSAYNTDLTQFGSYASQDGVLSGKIIVTSYSATQVKGTFEFEVPNEDSSLTTKKKITEGKFDVPYTTMTMP